MKQHLPWFAALAGMLLVSCMLARAETPPSDLASFHPAPPWADVAPVAWGNGRFALSLYGELAAQNKGNLFLSPYSISSAMTMVYLGAGGKTATEMAETLRVPYTPLPELPEAPPAGPWPKSRLADAYKRLQERFSPPTKPGEKQPKDEWAFQLHSANALWPQTGLGLKKEYVSLIQSCFGGEVRELDYGKPEEARKTINGWVEKQTQDKIKDLIGPGVLKRDTVLVLTNAVYFKSGWLEPFEPKATQKGPFHADGKEVSADMMEQTEHCGYAEVQLAGKEFQVLKLPYRSRDYAMLILLPRQAADLPAVEAALAAKPAAATQPAIDFDSIAKSLQSEPVHVKLPKFKMTSQFDLVPQLKALGIKQAFESKADFSGMFSTEKGILISHVLHKAFVEVREEGTEAAAATAVVMVGAMAPRAESPKEFIADHPFLFVVRDNATGTILFMGRLAEPS